MNSSRSPVVEDGVQREVDSENPFKWAASVGQGAEVAVVSDARAESNVESVGGPLSRRSGWLERVMGLFFRPKPRQEKPVSVEIEIKCNDLWESDWDVQVTHSEPVAAESLSQTEGRSEDR